MPDGGGDHNRAERRRIERQRRKGLREFHAAAGGAVTLRVIRAEAAAVLFFAAGGIARVFRRVVTDFHSHLPLQSCLICGRNFGAGEWPTDWALILPLGEAEPGHAMISGICGNCSDRHPNDRDLAMAAAEVLRRGLWPDLRQIDPANFHLGGGGRG